MDGRFDTPVQIRLHGSRRTVRSANEAVEILGDVGWPGERGPDHRDAYETCLKVIDGHRSTEDARARLIQVARAAGILLAP